ncbi:MAG: methyl-accepting chemotaxis protein [Clostridiales bacterium]|jgi:methyl-accepting chemotaxis protein|nr:methyl-accepting chemotaxis protein [Clostridiales bacterium]
MNWFKNLKIHGKLMTAFLAITAFLVLLAAISVKNSRDSDARYSNLIDFTVEGVNTINDSYKEYIKAGRAARDMIIDFYQGDAESRASLEAAHDSFNSVVGNTVEYLNKYDKEIRAKNPDSATEAKQSRKELVDRIESGLQDYKNSGEELYKYIKDGLEYEAKNGEYSIEEWELQDKELKAKLANMIAITDIVTADMDALMGELKHSATQVNADVTNYNERTVAIRIIISSVTLILTVIIALLVADIIRKPLVAINEAMKQVALGNFAGLNLRTNMADEIAGVGNAAADVTETVEGIISSMLEVAQAIQAGDIERRLPTVGLRGEYLKMAEAANKMIGETIDDTLLAVALAEKLSDGQFDMDIPVLPGKKVILTTTFEAVRGNLRAVVGDIMTLVDLAQKGELSKPADASKYRGGWNTVVSGINGILEACRIPLSEIQEVMSGLADGDLSVSVKGQYKGRFGSLAEAGNKTVSTVATYVKEIESVLTSMAEQDLSIRVTREYIGDYAPIRRSLDKILDNFNQLVKSISTSAEQVALGARQISESSMSLATNSTEQAAAVEELSASLSMISEQTQSNAENANKADSLARSAKETGVKGNNEMSGMLQSMNDINEASKSIGRIIKVIDDIAFQTNLLALNAAVEAARAGEHGKGFAVVAEEVRALAGRSAEAAKETSELIEHSLEITETGSKTANRTADALSEIIQQIEDISSVISDVSLASNEQNESITQITEGLSQIADATQKNTATSEESAASAEELSSQSDMLYSNVSGFKFR